MLSFVATTDFCLIIKSSCFSVLIAFSWFSMSWVIAFSFNADVGVDRLSEITFMACINSSEANRLAVAKNPAASISYKHRCG